MATTNNLFYFFSKLIKMILLAGLFIPMGTYSNSSAPTSSPAASNSSGTTEDPLAAVNTNAKTISTKEVMIQWSRQLGVTCIHCHNLDNFNDDSKLNFKIALKHTQMVKILQQEVFVERDKGNVLKVKVDCYMCHRGKEMPAYIEPPVQLTK